MINLTPYSKTLVAVIGALVPVLHQAAPAVFASSAGSSALSAVMTALLVYLVPNHGAAPPSTTPAP